MKAVGIILAGGKNERLGDLTIARAACAMPVASCYRAIDFTLSNMSNSGIDKVAVITQYNSRSLHDHLSSSKWWDFGSKQGGLFVFTPFLSNDNNLWFRGTADSIYQNISFLKRSNEPYVVIASGDGIYEMDYSVVIKNHIENEADITIVCKDVGHNDVSDYGVLTLDSDKRMLDFEEKPVEPTSSVISLGVYVISRTLLIKLLESNIAEARYDLVKDIIIRYRKKLKIQGFLHSGYWSSINCVESYFHANMDFLDKDIRKQFFHDSPFIYTKPKDEPPVKYNYSSITKSSLVGSGSILNGSVEKSILFRKVVTGEGSVIKNSIIMEGCYIGVGCKIENAILDKEVILSDGKQVIGELNNIAIIRKSTVL